MSASIYWYDFETFGRPARRTRASQFAGLRTDEDLNVIGEPLVLYCKPVDDFLPSPMACLITGITPQLALARGLNENDFISRINQVFSEPGTCVAGYNNIRFDDELTRQLLYRNLMDPYEREYRHGNSRWDILDMMRLCAATRPEGINWPRNDEGEPSFKLEHLTAANGIEHGAAHDALADVNATIAIARLVRQQQPQLYDFVYQLRDKKMVQQELDLTTRKPVLHVSGKYPARHGCLTLVMPICAHPEKKNDVIVYDLRQDPSAWLALPADEIRQRVFTSQAQLPEGVERVGLKVIHINKCPIVTTARVLEPELASRFEVDLARCREHWEMLQAAPGLAAKVAEVYAQTRPREQLDADYGIYDGFFSDYDRDLLRTASATRPEDLARLDLPFQDPRLPELLFRFRARNYPETLDPEELGRWQAFRQSRLSDPDARRHYQEEMEQARQQVDAGDDARGREVLDAVAEYVAALD